MPDTVRTLAALQTLLADNVAGDIGAQDVRDMLISLGTPGFVARTTTDPDDVMWSGDLAGLTEQTVSGTATWTEGQGVASVILNNQSNNDVSAILKPVAFSIGDEWVVPLLGSMVADGISGNLSAGLVFTDGTDATDNCVVGHAQVSQNDPIQIPTVLTKLVGRHGTLTDVSSAPWVANAGLLRDHDIYIKLIYQAANTFRLQFSPDGVSWSAFGEADIAKVMTPTHVGVAAWRVEAVDAIVTMGPVQKVA